MGGVPILTCEEPPLEGVLVATATYNEAHNVVDLLRRIRNCLGDRVHILIVDDNSPDGTSRLVSDWQLHDENVFLLTRKMKLGLGSAQRAIILYSITHKYRKLVTLDADMSHNPEDIPRLLARCEAGSVVIGSRYIAGGLSKMKGARNALSKSGNMIARKVFGTSLRELTSGFRVYDLGALQTAPLNRLKSKSYAFYLESIFFLLKGQVKVLEEPIVFHRRAGDHSKMPRLQIVFSNWVLLKIVLFRLMGRGHMEVEPWWSLSCCCCCHEPLLIVRKKRIYLVRDRDLGEKDLVIDRKASLGYKTAYQCLNCGSISRLTK